MNTLLGGSVHVHIHTIMLEIFAGIKILHFSLFNDIHDL